eukprot:CAMPEP_0173198012 /NCGR_PEP_ID=MMETSP1141-20130122/16465_1 /TAXON_ID=483371 /ORGANISM="non described non described, Strain CCMP2298" /LENGTH=85 /DNA_ID=CAMNT_0014122787 /DNA_START=199 /DNA_END=457 /DNA_ORIENTATION=+
MCHNRLLLNTILEPVVEVLPEVVRLLPAPHDHDRLLVQQVRPHRIRHLHLTRLDGRAPAQDGGVCVVDSQVFEGELGAHPQEVGF